MIEFEVVAVDLLVAVVMAVDLLVEVLVWA